MLVVNGWQLFAHPALLDQLGKLEKGVEHVKTKTPLDWQESPKTRLLETIRTLMFEIVPQDPTRTTYRQGDTLGDAYKHWFRVKFGNGRFRLFFRYSLDAKIIIYAWVNDETTMRTYGSKTDVPENAEQRQPSRHMGQIAGRRKGPKRKNSTENGQIILTEWSHWTEIALRSVLWTAPMVGSR